MHFLTGLPFSGQDEIIKILEQNPKIKLYKNSPLFNTTNSIIEQTLAQGGYDKQCPVEKRERIIKNVFDVYSDNEINIDVNYRWNYMLPLIKTLGHAKVICCVRDIVSILNQYEHDFNSKPYDHGYSSSVYSRCNDLMTNSPTIDAYQSVKQIQSSNLILLEYDTLMNNPDIIIKSIYKYLKLDYFEHDYSDIKPKTLPMLLPPDIINQYSNLEIWRV